MKGGLGTEAGPMTKRESQRQRGGGTKRKSYRNLEIALWEASGMCPYNSALVQGRPSQHLPAFTRTFGAELRYHWHLQSDFGSPQEELVTFAQFRDMKKLTHTPSLLQLRPWITGHTALLSCP